MYARGKTKITVQFINRVLGRMTVEGEEGSIAIAALSVSFYMDDDPNYAITVPMSNVAYILREFS